MTRKRIYRCGQNGCCPVVDDLGNGMVEIFDPSKPVHGSFTMTKEEYNALLKNGKPAE